MRAFALLMAGFALASCERNEAPAAGVVVADPVDVSRPARGVIDSASVNTCIVDYTCGLSHPGLGTSSRSTRVDLATCTRSTSTESHAYEEKTSPPQTTSAVLGPGKCDRVRAALLAVTSDDARREQEAAQMDSTACTLTATCGDASAPKISVQRQSLTGTGHVTLLIREL